MLKEGKDYRFRLNKAEIELIVKALKFYRDNNKEPEHPLLNSIKYRLEFPGGSRR